jgi:hypothetical protein
MTYAAEDVEILQPIVCEKFRSDYETLSRKIASFQKHLR